MMTELARILINEVRDRSARDSDFMLEAQANMPSARRYRHLVGQGDQNEVLRFVTAEAIDATIFHLLDAIDNGSLKLHWLAESGEPVDLGQAGRGELGGWYLLDDDDGWRALSQARWYRSDGTVVNPETDL